VEVWAEDEARLGLKPVARRVWALRGTRPTCNGRTRYQWLYVFGFVHPATGRSLFLLLPRVDAGVMSAALAEFARWADPEGRRILVLLIDNAGWHVAKDLVVPAGMVLHRLPAHTPELQPAEPLWPLVREAVANRTIDDLDTLDTLLGDRCVWLMDHPDTVRGPAGFAWAAALG
jgi:hypothetical protein